MVSDGRLSVEALEAITGIDPDTLAAVLRDRRPPTVMVPIEPVRLSPEESSRLSTLAAQLTVGFEIDSDARIVAMLESLVEPGLLTLSNIAGIMRVDVADLEDVLRDVAAVPAERKYDLGVRVSYLVNALNQARERHPKPDH